MQTTMQRQGARFEPEPGISDEDYSAILDSIRSWARTVERLPETFAPMGEEALRDNVLVTLNNQFGASSAEMFSRKGKTDILIQHGVGAIFISECKFWKGPKAFLEAVDQLLGYLVWRDTKAAIILFVRQTNVTEVAMKAENAAADHPRFKRAEPKIAEAPIVVLHHEGDLTREIRVALMIVPIPTGG